MFQSPLTGGTLPLSQPNVSSCSNFYELGGLYGYGHASLLILIPWIVESIKLSSRRNGWATIFTATSFPEKTGWSTTKTIGKWANTHSQVSCIVFIYYLICSNKVKRILTPKNTPFCSLAQHPFVKARMYWKRRLLRGIRLMKKKKKEEIRDVDILATTGPYVFTYRGFGKSAGAENYNALEKNSLTTFFSGPCM